PRPRQPPILAVATCQVGCEGLCGCREIFWSPSGSSPLPTIAPIVSPSPEGRLRMNPVAITIAACVMTRGIDDGRPAHPHRARFPVRHVVFVVKENRTFDNYFGKFPGANGATCGRISDGSVIPLAPLPDGPQGASHSWDAALLAYHHGAMDQFDLIPGSMGGALNMVQAKKRTFPI